MSTGLQEMAEGCSLSCLCDNEVYQYGGNDEP